MSKLCAEDDSCKCDGIVDQLMLMLDKVHQMSAAALQKLPTEQELQVNDRFTLSDVLQITNWTVLS